MVHIGFAMLIVLIVFGFHWFNSDKSIITTLFNAAGYTYGPLLGLYSFGLFSIRKVKDAYITFLCILSPFLTYLIVYLCGIYIPSYKFGFEILIINGLIVYISLYFYEPSEYAISPGNIQLKDLILLIKIIKMRFSILFFSMVLASHFAQGQGIETNSQISALQKGPIRIKSNFVPNDTLYMRMYKNGIKFGDHNLSINAMQALYALHPDSIKYLDSACIMYSETQQYAQCILSGNKVLQYRPDDIPIIEAVALSNQHVGRYPEALGLFQIEYEKNSSLYACYQIAVLQFSLQKQGEAQGNPGPVDC